MYLARAVVYDHLICSGLKKSYSIWKDHGEVCKASSSRMMSEDEGLFSHDMDGLLGDLFSAAPLESLVHMGESEMHAEFLKDLLRIGNLMPKTTHQVKKILANLGLSYEKIHACPNGCMLFWDGNEKEEVCSICGASRCKSTPEVASNDPDEVAPNDPDEAAPNDPDEVVAPKKKVRGLTKKKAIWNLKSHEKVVVTFNELAQPIGDEANEMTKFLGTLVRMSQHIGIEYREWRKVSEIKKEDL
nr:hypothetical protein [Tanacetum cinerariifolium]